MITLALLLKRCDEGRLAQVGESITAVRQQQLLEQYHFTCSCPACSQGACSAADARLVGLRCAGCAGPVVPSMACDAGVCSLQGLPALLDGAGRCFQCALKMQVLGCYTLVMQLLLCHTTRAHVFA